MSYSICRRGGALCDGCMDCYDKRSEHQKDYDDFDYDREYDDEDEEGEEV